ncbi:MAG: AAA family ATPase [Nitrospirae bacterium YQR-1]
MKRAENLKELLRAAKPFPLEGETYALFYTDTDKVRGQNSALNLCNYLRANYDDPQKILFMGHRGCGKSTELWRVSKELESDFEIISFSIKDETDTTDLNYTDVLFAILTKLVDAVPEGLRENQSILDNLISYWMDTRLSEIIDVEKTEAEAGAEAKIGILNAIKLRVKGVLKTGKESKLTVRKFIEPRLRKMIDSANDLIRILKEKLRKDNKEPLIIIEDLDKLDIPVATDLFLNHKEILTALDIHLIYTFPIFLHYSEKFDAIRDAFSYPEILSMIKVKDKNGQPNENGVEIIKALTGKRADMSLFDPDVIEFIIEHSGGALRHLFDMVIRAALISLGRGLSTISLDSAKSAYNELKSTLERSIADEHTDYLLALYKSRDKKPLRDKYLLELLNAAAVIEYNGDRWCDLHPAVVDILRDKRLI